MVRQRNNKSPTKSTQSKGGKPGSKSGATFVARKLATDVLATETVLSPESKEFEDEKRELQYLEGKLGLQGGKRQQRLRRLAKSLLLEDGFDAELLALANFLDSDYGTAPKDSSASSEAELSDPELSANSISTNDCSAVNERCPRGRRVERGGVQEAAVPQPGSGLVVCLKQNSDLSTRSAARDADFGLPQNKTGSEVAAEPAVEPSTHKSSSANGEQELPVLVKANRSHCSGLRDPPPPGISKSDPLHCPPVMGVLGRGEAAVERPKGLSQRTVSPKYLPPHLRTQGDTAVRPGGSATRAIRTSIVKAAMLRLRGLINRLSEGNLDPICAQLQTQVFDASINRLAVHSSGGGAPAPDVRLLLRQLCGAVATTIVATSILDTFSTASLLTNQVAVIAALSIRVTPQVAQMFFVELVSIFEQHWNQLCAHTALPEAVGSSNNCEPFAIGAPLDILLPLRRVLRFCASALGLSFSVGLLAGSSLLVFIRRLFVRQPIVGGYAPENLHSKLQSGATLTRDNGTTSPFLWETRLDLALTALSYGAPKLHAEDPEEFSELFDFLFAEVRQCRNEVSTASAIQPPSLPPPLPCGRKYVKAKVAGPRSPGNPDDADESRLGVLIRELKHLKGSRDARIAGVAESTSVRFVQSWVTKQAAEGFRGRNAAEGFLRSLEFHFAGLPNDSHDSNVAECLKLSNDPEVCLMIWKAIATREAEPWCLRNIGESGIHNVHSGNVSYAAALAKPSENLSVKKNGLPGAAATRDMLFQMAAQLRLHTDLQKSLFVALAGAQDPHSAVQRLLETGHKPAAIRHVIAVILHVNGHEFPFNSFYSKVLIHLASLPSSIGRRFQRAIKQGIAAQLGLILEAPLQFMLNFAQLFSSLCLNKNGKLVSLRSIRFLDIKKTRTIPELGVRGRLGLFLQKIFLEFCNHSPSDPGITNVVQAQIEEISSMQDIAEAALLVMKALVLPELLTPAATSLQQPRYSSATAAATTAETNTLSSVSNPKKARAERIVSLLQKTVVPYSQKSLM